MANVSKIFKPRRGTKSIMAGTKKSTVLASGELFVEVPDAGVGKGASKIKIGDGTTAYSSLPYALGDTSNDQITFSSNTSTTVAAALNSVTSGGSLKNIVAGLKQAVSLCNTSITKLNDDITSFQTGVDTIVNGCTTYGSTPTASTPTAIVNSIKAIYTNRYNAGVTATKKGNAAPGQVLSGKTFTNSSTVGATGTMTNRGAWTNTPTSSGKVTIPAGYHNGSGYVDTSKVYTAGYNAGESSAGSWEVDLKITFRVTRSIGPALNYTSFAVYHITNTNGTISYNLTSGSATNTTDGDGGAVISVSIESMTWSNYKVL